MQSPRRAEHRNAHTRAPLPRFPRRNLLTRSHRLPLVPSAESVILLLVDAVLERALELQGRVMDRVLEVRRVVLDGDRLHAAWLRLEQTVLVDSVLPGGVQ